MRGHDMVEYIDTDEFEINTELPELLESGSATIAQSKKENRGKQLENRWRIEEIMAERRMREIYQDPFEIDE
jgi:hypothetical protein